MPELISTNLSGNPDKRCCFLDVWCNNKSDKFITFSIFHFLLMFKLINVFFSQLNYKFINKAFFEKNI